MRSTETLKFFFYGTLLDADVRHLVLGSNLTQLRTQSARLPQYRCARARAGGYPVLVRQAGRMVTGQSVAGLDRAAILALGHFEGEHYAPRRLPVIGPDGSRYRAVVFVPWRKQGDTGPDWNLKHWQRTVKPRLMPLMSLWAREFGAETLQSCDVPWHVRRQILALCKGSEG